MTLTQRIELEAEKWEPTRVEGTGVDEEEALYASGLYPIPLAVERLQGSLGASIVNKGWELIQLRLEVEKMMAQDELACKA